jgi:hypothetical protein
MSRGRQLSGPERWAPGPARDSSVETRHFARSRARRQRSKVRAMADMRLFRTRIANSAIGVASARESAFRAAKARICWAPERTKSSAGADLS